MKLFISIIAMCLISSCSKVFTDTEFELKYGKVIKTEPCIVQVVTDRNLIVQYIITKDNKKQVIWSGKIKQ